MNLGATQPHLPMTRKEMVDRGWDELDVLLVTGDAYFDHPSHGAAVIGRVLEDAGFRVGIVARPRWRSTDDFTVMGRPALFVGITAGAVDSMVNNYTADLARRRDDVYAPGKEGMGRPNLATVVYANLARQAFPGVPVVIGGVEASTRRFAYYDYLKNTIRRSILFDSRADILVFGPGEKQVVEIAHRLASNESLSGIAGTCRIERGGEQPSGVVLPAFEEILNDRTLLIRQTGIVEQNLGPYRSARLVQQFQQGLVVYEPPAMLTTPDLDRIYQLPFNRRQHPSYTKPVPALETVKWSVVALRGCPGGCSFCALAMHQGRLVIQRSKESVLQEIENLASDPEFKGTLSDIGGPTANTYGILPKDRARCEACKRLSCLYPGICTNLDTSHAAFLSLLEQASRVKNVKKILIASGMRHDLALKDIGFIRAIAAHHTGGHLKVAPEHVDSAVLKLMRKPPLQDLEKFECIFMEASREAGLEQYLVPYFIAGFPGCTPGAADAAGVWLRKRGQRLRQVQTFIPLPGTMAAALYACGTLGDGTPIFVADLKERRRQKRILTGGGKKFH